MTFLLDYFSRRSLIATRIGVHPSPLLYDSLNRFSPSAAVSYPSCVTVNIVLPSISERSYVTFK